MIPDEYAVRIPTEEEYVLIDAVRDMRDRLMAEMRVTKDDDLVPAIATLMASEHPKAAARQLRVRALLHEWAARQEGR